MQALLVGDGDVVGGGVNSGLAAVGRTCWGSVWPMSRPVTSTTSGLYWVKS